MHLDRAFLGEYVFGLCAYLDSVHIQKRHDSATLVPDSRSDCESTPSSPVLGAAGAQDGLHIPVLVVVLPIN